jgi:hypothetical protein
MTFQILVDSMNVLNLEKPSEGIRRFGRPVSMLKQALTMKASPNKQEEDDEFLAVLYTTADVVPLKAQLFHERISALPLTPDQDAQVTYTLKQGVNPKLSGSLAYNAIERAFMYQMPISGDLTTGTYLPR